MQKTFQETKSKEKLFDIQQHALKKKIKDSATRYDKINDCI